ncbi:RluA family pseudouridine synthase [Buchnera aphidicola]|uniref:Pseudouridine synthase n=1 Tax=Buchnera aphidicola (Therioaphis trifolii) TaxID=1241884 RepID=A0A4D6YMZ6_9GAMM|nr:RluA family pseudouridine synthase [Buchnera aphidicola]QCI27228.1 RluA family pseudouridine synthase [Buchnera aphidicola (Therioaphis trifolii)]
MYNKNILNIKITANESEQRIDNFIRKKFQKISKNKLYKIIRIGCIKVNQKKTFPSYKLKINDTLSYFKDIQLKENKYGNIILSKNIKKKILSSILFEDNDLLVINKPSGIAVHGGSGLKFGIIEIFRILKPKCKFLELIHRIDRDTSGILMLAKKKSILRDIHKQFREKKIFKKYIAIVHGILNINKQHIFASLKKNKLKNGIKIVKIDPLGQKSLSIIKVKKRFNENTLIEIIPKTGRTHQIRVHCAYIGYPIIFDNIYGNHELDYNIHLKKKYKKILLHANEIRFYHPKQKKQYFLNAPLRNRFKIFLNQINKQKN